MTDTAQMPRYQCHKKVRAVQITNIQPVVGGAAILTTGPGIINVAHSFMSKHSPQVGGYFVVYDDGYESYSPAKAFEDGYTLIEET